MARSSAIPVTPCHTLRALTSSIPSSGFSITMPVLAKEVFKPRSCLSQQFSTCDTWCLKTSRFAGLLLFSFLARRPFPDARRNSKYSNRLNSSRNHSKPSSYVCDAWLCNVLHMEGQQKSSKIQASASSHSATALELPEMTSQDDPRSKTNQN